MQRKEELNSYNVSMYMYECMYLYKFIFISSLSHNLIKWKFMWWSLKLNPNSILFVLSDGLTSTTIQEIIKGNVFFIFITFIITYNKIYSFKVMAYAFTWATITIINIANKPITPKSLFLLLWNPSLPFSTLCLSLSSIPRQPLICFLSLWIRVCIF